MDKRPVEVFILMGRNGDCGYTMTAALGITISKALQSGGDLGAIVEDLLGVSCFRRITLIEGNGKAVGSCVDAVAQVLRDYLSRPTPPDPKPTPPTEGCLKGRSFGVEGCRHCHLTNCRERHAAPISPDDPPEYQ